MTIAVSIPIDLSSRKEIAETLLAKYGTEYLFLGRIFQETTTNQSCEIEISNAQKDEKFDNNYDGKVVRLISTDVGDGTLGQSGAPPRRSAEPAAAGPALHGRHLPDWRYYRSIRIISIRLRSR